MFKYTIDDVPPSNNKYLGSGGRGRNFQYQNEKKKWAEMIVKVVGKDKPDTPFEHSTVTLKYYFETRHRRDPDNYSGKFILDGIVEAGVIEDDSFRNINLIIEGGYDEENPRTVITVEERVL